MSAGALRARLHRPGAGGIPLADAPLLARPAARTRLARLVLGLALSGALAAAVVVAARAPVQHSSFFPAGGSGVVVLDFSSSIDVPGYRRITSVLRPVVEANQPVGVVYFSDVAYEALPPATPGRELRPFLRFLETPRAPGSVTSPQRLEALARWEARPNPWSAAFRGGTRISSGLEAARLALARDRVRPATVLLISDLDDSPFDLPRLAEVLAAYRRDGIRLRIVPLQPSDDDRAYFVRALGPSAFVTHAELLANARATEHRSLDADFPLAVVLLVGALLVLLAVNELRCGRLAWRVPRGAEG